MILIPEKRVCFILHFMNTELQTIYIFIACLSPVNFSTRFSIVCFQFDFCSSFYDSFLNLLPLRLQSSSLWSPGAEAWTQMSRVLSAGSLPLLSPHLWSGDRRWFLLVYIGEGLVYAQQCFLSGFMLWSSMNEQNGDGMFWRCQGHQAFHPHPQGFSACGSVCW